MKGLKHKGISSLLAIALATGWAYAQSSTPLSTTDGFAVASVGDSLGQALSALPMDGSKGIITIGLAGGGTSDSTLRYTAYNLDLSLPYGVEPAMEGGAPDVVLPQDFSIYAKRIGLLSHSIAANVRGDGQTVRVACSSNSNKDFRNREGDLFEMGVRVCSPYYQPGENKILLSNQNLTIRANAQKYVPKDTFRLFHIDEGMVSVRLIVSAQSGYSTCVLPFAIEVPAGLTAYECSGSEGDTLFLNQTDYLQAYTPYIIYAREGFSATLSGMTSARLYHQRVDADGVARSGLLRGALRPQSVSEGYVLTRQDGQTLFLNAKGQEYQVPAGRCWIQAHSQSPAFVMVEDGLQAISDATARTGASRTDMKSAPAYDLQGHRLLVPQRGINIVGGKKVVY